MTRRFSSAICYVGKDVDYSISTVEVINNRGYKISALIGKTASIVKDKLNLKVISINEKLPWKNKEYHRLLTKETVGINCGFEYIIPKEVLMNHEVVNIHPAVLPYNRGCHHSFWGIIDKTPLGATLHWMTTDLDAGPIICQKSFKDDGTMTARDIQNTSNVLCLELLKENIDNIMNGETVSVKQGEGTYHSKKDIIPASILRMGDSVTVDYLYDLCRATCNKDNGFIIEKKNGERITIIIKDMKHDNQKSFVFTEG